jgi:2-oxoglutarate dehydrogenase E2 component (dihydrolipoamide succinyltransferase)
VAEVLIPVLNANDEHYVLTERLVSDGAGVQAGDSIAIVETSKAATELACHETGILHWLTDAMSDCRPGQSVARIVAPGSAVPVHDEPGPGGARQHSGVTITKAARQFMRERGLTEAQVAESGKRLIRVADVEAISRQEMSTSMSRSALPRNQQAVARTVSRSHATIPSAFLAIKVAMPSAAVPVSSEHPAEVASSGLAERVIGSVAAMSRAFPLMFARVGEDLSLTGPGSIDIGVTIDVGKGLTIPTIPAADGKDVSDIAARLLALRVKAMRRTLTSEDLGEPCLVVALQQEPGIVFSIPIVYPGNVCAVSVGALAWEVVPRSDGQLGAHACFQLGLSYDHRFVNGRDAALFLSAIRDHLIEIASP